MTTADFLAWIPTVISLLIVISVFAGRTWIQKRIERSVQHTFDGKLANIQSDLRNSEERFKGELRAKESEISTLRDGVLTGRVQRQALLDKRRLDAIDRVWSAMMDMAPYVAIAGMMQRVNLEYVAKEAPRNESIRKFVAAFTDNTFKIPTENVAKNERPFVTPGLWAYYSAYQTVLLTIFAQAKAIELGLEDSDKMIKTDVIRDMLKKALPHQSNNIDKHTIFVFSIFVGELEDCVLQEISKMLDGHDVDQASLTRAAEIIRASSSASAQLAAARSSLSQAKKS